MIRVMARNLTIAVLGLAFIAQFDSPIRNLLLQVANRISLAFTGSALG